MQRDDEKTRARASWSSVSGGVRGSSVACEWGCVGVWAIHTAAAAGQPVTAARHTASLPHAHIQPAPAPQNTTNQCLSEACVFLDFRCHSYVNRLNVFQTKHRCLHAYWQLFALCKLWIFFLQHCLHFVQYLVCAWLQGFPGPSMYHPHTGCTSMMSPFP